MSIWKRIPGFSEYEISDSGDVRSYIPWRKFPVPRILTSYDDGYGRYLRLRLRNDSGKMKMQRIHILVLRTFHGEKIAGQEARHKDGNMFNNAATNLKWGSHSENILDQVAHGTHNMIRGKIK